MQINGFPGIAVVYSCGNIPAAVPPHLASLCCETVQSVLWLWDAGFPQFFWRLNLPFLLSNHSTNKDKLVTASYLMQASEIKEQSHALLVEDKKGSEEKKKPDFW